MHGWKVLMRINVHFKKKDFIIHSEKETDKVKVSTSGGWAHRRGSRLSTGQGAGPWARTQDPEVMT